MPLVLHAAYLSLPYFSPPAVERTNASFVRPDLMPQSILESVNSIFVESFSFVTATQSSRQSRFVPSAMFTFDVHAANAAWSKSISNATL